MMRYQKSFRSALIWVHHSAWPVAFHVCMFYGEDL